MAVYQNIADNTGPIKVWVNIDVSSITRSNNTVTINNLQAEHWTPTSGAFDAAQWLADVEWPRGALRIGSAQTKPGTGSANITNNHYFSGGASFSYGVGTGDSSTEINTRINTDGSWKGWVSDQWGSVFIGIPTVSGPSISGGSVSGVTPTQANVAWTAGTGSNCTYSETILEWGPTTGYGSSTTAGQNDNRTLTGLTPGIPYFFRLTAVNGVGLTAQSTGSFTTTPVPGIVPILLALM